MQASEAPSFERFHHSLHRVFDRADPLSTESFEKILAPVPSVEECVGFEAGTQAILRLDLDVPIDGGEVVDDSRIQQSLPTIQSCIAKGWKLIIIGHAGRDGSRDLRPVTDHLSNLLDSQVAYVGGWHESGEREDHSSVSMQAKLAVDDLSNGGVLLLGNLRQYDFERRPWRLASPVEVSEARALFDIATSIRSRLGVIEIHDAIAASNKDFSTTVLPLAMENVAFGAYLRDEFSQHMNAARQATCIVFSGVKADKLDDLENLVNDAHPEVVICGGALAMSLVKSRSMLDGRPVSIGAVEYDESNVAYVAPGRIAQASRIIQRCRASGVELVLPIDFVLDDGRVSDTIPEGRVQLDVGPRTRELFDSTVQLYTRARVESSHPAVLFFNGVLGLFEEDAFSGGTASFVKTLMAATSGGAQTYVGGGEGRLAVSKFGDLRNVTHAFTAGGTVLKSMTRNVEYLKAFHLASLPS